MNILNNNLSSVNTVEDIRKRILAFREPVFGENPKEKQKIIDQNYPGVFPCRPILDINLSNYFLAGTITQRSWNALVRYSMKLPNFHPRIIQPRVTKCYDNESDEFFYTIKKYGVSDMTNIYHYFDPLYFSGGSIPIYLEYVDIMKDHNNKNIATEQLKYCYTNLQARSLITIYSLFPTETYNLSALGVNEAYRKGYYIDTNSQFNDIDMNDNENIPNYAQEEY